MTLRVLDPTFDSIDTPAEVVPRLPSLVGRTVGLLDNSKRNVGTVLNHVEAVLRSQHGVSNVIRLHKPDASRPAPAGVLEDMKKCDAVISAVGD